MDGWIDVGTRSDFLPGEYKVVWDGDTPIAVYNIDGALYAIEDVCTHDGGDLAGGLGAWAAKTFRAAKAPAWSIFPPFLGP